jgi:hypothetical protein
MLSPGDPRIERSLARLRRQGATATTPVADRGQRGELGTLTDTEAKLREALATSPDLADRIARQLLIVLHSEGLISIDAVYDEARAEAGHAATTPADDNPNRPGAAPWSAGERVAVRDTVLQHAAALLTPERVQTVIDGVRRLDEAESLESIASLDDVPFDVLSAALRRFCRLPRGDEAWPRPAPRSCGWR